MVGPQRVGRLARVPGGGDVREDVGPAERVDGLLRIAHQQQRAGAVEDPAEDPELYRIGVLELVDEGGLELPAQRLGEPIGPRSLKRLVEREEQILVALHAAGSLAPRHLVAHVRDGVELEPHDEIVLGLLAQVVERLGLLEEGVPRCPAGLLGALLERGGCHLPQCHGRGERGRPVAKVGVEGAAPVLEPCSVFGGIEMPAVEQRADLGARGHPGLAGRRVERGQLRAQQLRIGRHLARKDGQVRRTSHERVDELVRRLQAKRALLHPVQVRLHRHHARGEEVLADLALELRGVGQQLQAEPRPALERALLQHAEAEGVDR